MIRPPTGLGVAFSEAEDGDIRSDRAARMTLAERLGVDDGWATVRQVHGAGVVRAHGPGDAGEADAVWTLMHGLPVAVFTADCLGVVVHSDAAVGVAHAGWRGVVAGVVSNLIRAMSAAGHQPSAAWIGPGIGPCCFEVGVEVSSRFDPGLQSSTTWQTQSIDLITAVRQQLAGVDVWSAGGCTMHEDRWFSHRANATAARMAALGWLE